MLATCAAPGLAFNSAWPSLQQRLQFFDLPDTIVGQNRQMQGCLAIVIRHVNGCGLPRTRLKQHLQNLHTLAWNAALCRGRDASSSSSSAHTNSVLVALQKGLHNFKAAIV